jgi:hypothetical protein
MITDGTIVQKTVSAQVTGDETQYSAESAASLVESPSADRRAGGLVGRAVRHAPCASKPELIALIPMPIYHDYERTEGAHSSFNSIALDVHSVFSAVNGMM